tara:strand:+ start:108949 stop:110793 length:1845 start_codon:yes stop_codon:yes gene_type:complete
MTEEKKSEKTATEEDWGVEKPKSGIAIETKVGLCLICILLSAFGLVVYQKINRPQEALAVNGPAEGGSETDQQKEPDPFAEGNSDATAQVAGQSTGMEAQTGNSGFATPPEGQNQENPFAMQQPTSQGVNEFSRDAFANQNEPQQPVEIAAKQVDKGFQQFDSPAGTNNEFQAAPATFDNPKQDPFSGTDQFAQQPGANSQTAPQQNAFNSEPQSEFSPAAEGANSGLMEQPAANEFAQAAGGATGAVQVEEDPFGGAAVQPGQNMPAQSQQPAENGFDNFGLSEETDSAQLQNSEELPAKTAKVKITDISSSKEFGSFDDPGFSQSEPQASTTQNEKAFSQEMPAADTQEFEQPTVSEFSESNPSQNEERFGNFRAEEFSAQQAESVTTVKRPAAAIDSSSFRDVEVTAQQVPQARGLFDGPAPVREVSTQEFGSQQETAFNQKSAVHTGGEYTVENGENFWTISKKLYGSGRYFQLLAEINKNRVSDPRKMKPGLKLLTPDRASIDAQYQARHKATQTTVTEFAGAGAVRKTNKPAGFFISQDGRPMYRVGGSDTLTDISQKHLGRSSRWYQIYQINRENLQNPNKLQIGTELQLPYDASRVSLVPGNSSSR